MKAHRRPVSGCGSQRMLHALERRSHPADHGPSFASLYSPFCRYATSSPDRGKSLLAGGGQLSCNFRTGQIKNPPSECSGSNHIRHSYRMGPATTTTAASGRCREELLGQRPARRTCRPRHARMLGAATRGTKKEPTGLFFAACGRPCSFDSSYGLHETATTLDIPGRWDPRTKQQPTGLIAYPAAQGRAVSGCGSQRMLHALERRSHSADHGPSFASLFPPLAAVSSAAIPVRVKLKTPLRNAAAATTLDIPSRWDPRANQSPTGALVAVLRTAALFDSRTGQIKNALAQCAKAFL